MLNSSIRCAINFPTVVKTDFASSNELLDFSVSILQTTYGYLLVQASYSQFDQFFKQWSRLPAVSSELWYCICLVLGRKSFTVLVFRALGFSGMILRVQLLEFVAISEQKRFSQDASRA